MNFEKEYLRRCYATVLMHPDLMITEKAMADKARKKHFVEQPVDLLPAGLETYYRQMNGLTLRWEKPGADDEAGRIQLSGLEQLFTVQSTEIEPALMALNDDYDYGKKHHVTGYFYKLDYLTEQHSVGFFSDESLAGGLFYENAHRFYRLHLDFYGYFELLVMTRGFLYWPHAILSLEYGYGQAEAEWMRERLPAIFPDFSMEDFLHTYTGLKFPMDAP